jgi:broad specificity phosphatase PhoE
MTLLVARHASVTTKGVCYGQSDVPVSLDDEAACDIVTGQLAAFATPVVRVWSSPWQRAWGPAERVAAKLGVVHTIDERLSELAFGEWEGRPYAELETEPAFQAWMASWQSAAPPGGERLEDLLRRVSDWRAEVLLKGEPALAITHAGVIRALRAQARRAAYADVVGEPVEPLRLESL